MRTRKAAGALIALTGVIANWSAPLTTASAHHGGAVEWGEQELGPLTGTATKFAFQFPHVYVSVNVTQESGEVAQWTFATRWTPTILRSHGWSRDSIKPGDSLKVTYRPHIESPRIGSIVSIEVNGEALPIDFE